MPNPVVFYAWQMDRPRSQHRDLVRNAAQLAIDRLGAQLSVEESPRLDHDTANESGIPAIGETIFRKIRQAAVFLADVTFVGKADAGQGDSPKRLPNPNVLIELGFAAGTIGWDRIILVMNAHHGHASRLPFDLRFRRFPISYGLAPSGAPTTVENALAQEIEAAIQQCLSKDYDRVRDVLARITSYSRSLMQEHGSHQSFHETQKDNVIVSRLDLAIMQLLELGVIWCVPAESPAGVAYAWTYLGRECCRQIGKVPCEVPANFVPTPTYVLTGDRYQEVPVYSEVAMTYDAVSNKSLTDDS